MSKPKFDVELFYSLPRGVGKIYDYSSKSYCAWGAGFHAMGFDLTRDSDQIGIRENITNSTGIDMWSNKGSDIIGMNDTGQEPEFYNKRREIIYKLAKDGQNQKAHKFVRRADTLRKPNPERANKMLLDYLQSNDLVEFVNVSYAPRAVDKVESLV